MVHDEVVQIKVSGQAVGIIGLKSALEELGEDYRDRPEEEVQAELLRRLSKKNYIPDRAKVQYGQALFREFKKFLGIPLEEDGSTGLEVKVLGPGCAQCDRLEQDVMAAMAELKLAGDIQHIRDVKEIAKYGVMGTPALIINGKVKSVGKVPPKSRLLEWLKGAQEA
jgi:small redox-active disulfide protein 2